MASRSTEQSRNLFETLQTTAGAVGYVSAGQSSAHGVMHGKGAWSSIQPLNQLAKSTLALSRDTRTLQKLGKLLQSALEHPIEPVFLPTSVRGVISLADKGGRDSPPASSIPCVLETHTILLLG